MKIKSLNRFLCTFIGALVLVGVTMVVHAGDNELLCPTTAEEITAALKPNKIRTRGIRTRGFNCRGVDGIVEDRKVGAMIQFDLNSAVIRPESYKLLDEFGKAFSEGLKGEHFVVAGHTDATGSEQYNYRLSINRAQAVASYLVGRHQLDASRFSIEGHGEDLPIGDNNTSSGRAMNRRVEFVCR